MDDDAFPDLVELQGDALTPASARCRRRRLLWMVLGAGRIRGSRVSAALTAAGTAACPLFPTGGRQPGPPLRAGPFSKAIAGPTA